MTLTTLTVVMAVASAVLVPLLLTIFEEWCPWLAERIIHRAARAYSRRHRARFLQEYGAELDVLVKRGARVTSLFWAGGVWLLSGRAAAELQAGEKVSREVPDTLLLKRMLDVTVSVGMLLFAAPLLLVIAALVKLRSPGPVLFRQVRIGENGKPFAMLKFRTMHVNSNLAIREALSTAPAAGDTASTAFMLAEDPRVTPIGRLLRKTSLDELPQFWNVIRGDMSLVGPRAPLSHEVKHYKPWHRRRLEAKPGITGLWQISGRSRTTFDDMVRLDLRYIKHRSLWTDLKVLLATPYRVYRRQRR